MKAERRSAAKLLGENMKVTIMFKDNEACCLEPLDEKEERMVDAMMKPVAVAKSKCLCG